MAMDYYSAVMDTPSTVTTAWVGERLGKPWRSIRKEALAAQPALATFGWTYQPGKGRARGGFHRAGMEARAA